MKTIVVYKSKYGSAKTYANWIAQELGCTAENVKNISVKDLMQYDKIVYGGGLYAEIIGGLFLITKNIDLLKNKKIAVYSCGITPLDCRDYYDKMVIEKNFKNGVPENVKVFNFMGKMIMDELTLVHRSALKTLKKIMSSKENPTEMEKLLVDLCDADGDFMDKESIKDLVDYIRN
ncbi:MAG: flavodoxin [Clostridia bacterium]|nr:flavodoxin [Clostridia bacterium]MBR2878081.1 flavodoxin [Clostridia bacterium]MBR2973445.1 flavodoxin [Clostridia bacterium]